MVDSISKNDTVLGFRLTITDSGLYMELFFPTEESGPYMYVQKRIREMETFFIEHTEE